MLPLRVELEAVKPFSLLFLILLSSHFTAGLNYLPHSTAYISSSQSN